MSALLFLLVIALSPSLLPDAIPMGLLLFVAVSDLFFAALVQVSMQVFVAFQELRWTSAVNMAFGVIRLAAALVLTYLVAAPTPLAWGALYLSSTVLTALFGAALVYRRSGLPALGIVRDAAELKEGVHFSVTLASQSAYNDIDKTMLSRMSGLEAAGTYAAAYRFCDAVFMPVSAVLYASYARFFQHGARGVGEASVSRGNWCPSPRHTACSRGYSFTCSPPGSRSFSAINTPPPRGRFDGSACCLS